MDIFRIVTCWLTAAAMVDAAAPLAPRFSWDRVPQFIHCSNSSGPLNDAILAAMTAPSIGFVVIEKYQCQQCAPVNDGGEGKELAAAAQVKALNASVPVFFYFAVDYARTWYSLGHYFDANPDLEVHNVDGSLATVSSDGYTWHIFDFSVAAARAAWVGALVNVSQSGLIDGFFIDGYRSPASWTRGLIPNASQSEQAAWLQGVNATGLLLQDSVPAFPRIMNPGQELQSYAGYNAISIEFFDGSLSSVTQLAALGGAGTLLEVHTYAGSNDALFNASLAAFLVAATENAFYGAGSTWSTCDSWLIPRVELSKPLGAPLGPANVTASGTLWTRAFVSGTVAMVNATGSSVATCIVWGDGYKTGDGCYAAGWRTEAPP